MTDVTRAVLLPGGVPPSDATLKTLALYWDEVVISDGTYRGESFVWRREDMADSPERSEVARALEAAGALRRVETETPAEALLPMPRPPNEDPEGELFLALRRDENGRVRYAGTLLLDRDKLGPPDPPTRTAEEADEELLLASAALSADVLLARARQTRELAAANNLAPVATSLVSHLASLTAGDDPEVPVAEGALLGAAMEAFVLNDETSVEDLLSFREEHAGALGRFRAAMADLAVALRQPEIAPEAALAAARDALRNRVQPELSNLETRLNESRLKFVARSVFGAAALAVSPLGPVTAVEAGAQIGGQTINYRFSRERLLEEHPYGYLQRLQASDLVTPRERFTYEMVSPTQDPGEAVRRHFEAKTREILEYMRMKREFEKRGLSAEEALQQLWDRFGTRGTSEHSPEG
jgi:hypothetical protein